MRAQSSVNPVFQSQRAFASVIGSLGRVEYMGRPPALKRAAVFAREIEHFERG